MTTPRLWPAFLLLWTFLFTPQSATASRSEVHFLPNAEQREAALGVRFDHYNGRGDVVSQTDGAGATKWEAAYEAYGKRVREVGTTKDRQKANTKDEDPTGLLNEGMRYRDLETGVWLSRDPAGFVDGPNLYAYVTQNPWSKFDPEGLSMWSAAWKAIRKGGNIVDAFSGAADHLSKAAESTSFMGAAGHTWAALSEVLPVSVSDVESAFDTGKSAIDAGKAAASGDPSKALEIATEELVVKGIEKAVGGKKSSKNGVDNDAPSTAKTVDDAAAKGGDSYVYGVIDTHSGTLAKPGMSSGPMPDRMNQSVKTADERSGVPGQHKGVILEKGKTPEQARESEQKLTDKVEVRRPGTFPNKFHQRPTPKVETKEQFKEKYGHEHNR